MIVNFMLKDFKIKIMKKKMKTINKIDPVFQFVILICRRFFKSGLLDWEYDFVMDNVNKHRKVLWLNIISVGFVLWGLVIIEPKEISTIIGALLAPAMVTGGAWFGITFGGIPKKLLDSAVDITFWMFLAFTLSLTTMVVSMIFITPWMLWPVFIFIELGVIISCIMYDNADGLKIGLDDTLLKHSRAALLSFVKTGAITIHDIDEFEKSIELAKMEAEKKIKSNAK